jgi:hypothetical protein
LGAVFDAEEARFSAFDAEEDRFSATRGFDGLR